MRKTSLAIITIAAKVNSATGTALAAAALDTTMPCSHVAGVTVIFTVPAAYARSRSFGMRASSASSRTLQPQLPDDDLDLAEHVVVEGVEVDGPGCDEIDETLELGPGRGREHEVVHARGSSPRRPADATCLAPRSTDLGRAS